MNKIYNSIWNEITGTFVAVAETAKARGKRVSSHVASGLTSLFKLQPLALALMASGIAHAAPPVPTQLPTGGNVVAGQASISQANAVMTVNQTSNRAVVDWSTFNIGSSAAVNFVQPSSSSATLNRVNDANPSQILGRINANGQVFLTNASGIYFGKDATVNVGALTATTHGIGNADFMAGNLSFSRNGATGSVVNDGTINAALGGYIALLAPEVRNNGVVVAQMGTVALAAGDAYELQFDGTRLANVRVELATIAALVENKQAVQAPGGLIILSAQAANRLQGGVVNNSGSLEATGLTDHGGTIRLSASNRISHTGTINADAAANSAGNGGSVILLADLANKDSLTEVNGSISARGGNLGGDGGFIETSAGTLKIGSATRVDTRAPQGKGGQWLLDPTNFTIGTDITGADLSAQLANTSVAIQTDATSTTAQEGSIYVNEAVSWNAATVLMLNAYHNIYINQPVNAASAGAGLILFYGNPSNPKNANSRLQINAPVNMLPGASLRIGHSASDWSNYTIFNNLDDLRTAISTEINGSYALGNDLDLTNSSTGNAINPLSGFGTRFTGTFEGLGHTISNFRLNYSGISDIGLFGRLDGLGTIRNITIDNAQVDGLNNVGVLVGRAGGDGQAGLTTIYNSHVINSTVNASDTTPGTDANVGGLVGNAWGGLIDGSSARNITVTGSGNNAGGLIGQISQAILHSSYATGTVSSPSGNNVGGLAGLVGQMGDATSNSYAQVDVVGNDNVGGLFGSNQSFAVKNSFYPIERVTIQGRGMTSGQHLVTAYGIYDDQWTYWNINKGLGSVDSVFGSTVDGYYIVNTDTQRKALLGFAAEGYGGNKFKLGQDFDVPALTNGYDWHLPVFLASELNGGGHAIKNMVINQPFNDYVGLIGKLHPASDLTNLVISDATVAGRNYVGGAVGFAFGDANSHPISQVSVTVDAAATSIQGGTGTDNLGAGGLIGYSERGANNNAVGIGVAVSGYSNVGGLIGYLGANDKTVAVSANTANATVNGVERVGGLIGYVDATASVASSDVSFVGNTVGGSVTGTGDHVGGLVGFAMAYGDSNPSIIAIQNNTTNAAVSGQNNVGGLAGFIQGYGYGGTASIQISGNTSRGTTQGTGASVGGLVGHAFAGGDYGGSFYGTSPSSIAFSTNQTFGRTTGGTQVGGLVGYALAGQSSGSTSSITFNGDVVHGDVNGWSQVGGVIGKVYVEGINSTATVTVTNAVVHGLVTSNEDDAGGLVGRVVVGAASGGYGYGSSGAGAGTFSVSASTSYGVVQGGRNSIGGLIGYAEANGGNGNATIDISNNTAKGAVSGTNDVGGLIGRAYVEGHSGSSAINITNSKAYGDVSGSANNVGGLIGSVSAAGYGSSYTGTVSISGSEFMGVSVSGMGSVGGLVGDVSASSYGRVNIDDSHARDAALQVTGTAADYVGGLIGRVDASGGSGDAVINISNNTANGSVSGLGKVGGLIGSVSASGNSYTGAVNITGSEFLGVSVTGIGDRIGGLVGSVSVSSSGSSVSIDSSHASNVALQVSGNDSVGGLVGYAEANAGYGNATINISNSTAKGAVSGNNDVGGLIGRAYAYGHYGSATINVTTNKAYGNVSGVGNNVGGLIGSVSAGGYGSSYTGTVNISGSEFMGASVTSSGDHVGGLVGDVSASSYGSISIDSSHARNAGLQVTGNDHVGGLVGRAYAYGNYGDASITISNGTAKGAVSGNDNVGGLIGSVHAQGGSYGGYGGSARVNITANQFDGSVTGANKVGGLIGSVYAAGAGYGSSYTGTVNIDQNGFTGTSVSGTGDQVGGLIGSVSADGSYGAASITISNSSATGVITGVNSVGGLVGSVTAISGNYGGTVSVSDNTFTGARVQGSGDGVGGLVGVNGQGTVTGNTVERLAATTDPASWMEIIGQNNVGGLIGSNANYDGSGNFGLVQNNAVRTAKIQGVHAVGGLIGLDESGALSNNTVGWGPQENMQQPRVSVAGDSSVGGLIGETAPSQVSGYGAQISQSKVWAAVAGHTEVGGLIGSDTDSMIDQAEVVSSGDGMIMATANAQHTVESIGGLVGRAIGTTVDGVNVHAVINITDATATTIRDVGGMIGYGEGITVSPSTSSTGLRSSVGVYLMVDSTGSPSGTSTGIGGAIGRLDLTPSTVALLTVNGSVSVRGRPAMGVGGAIGQFNYGILSEISAETSNLTVPVGSSNMGGLIGAMVNTSVTDAYANVTSTDSVNQSQSGGLVGLIDGNSSITNTYVTGSVRTPTLTGALVGAVGSSWTGSITSSYYLNTLGSASVKGVGSTSDVQGSVESKSAAQLNDINTFVNWAMVDSGQASSPELTFGGSVVKWHLHSLASHGTVFARLEEGSSTYGNVPVLTYKIYDAATGGNEIPNTYTGASGSVVWDTTLSASTGVGTYPLTYVSGITLGVGSAYTLNSGSAMNWVINPRPLNVTVTKVYNGNATFNTGFVFTGMVNNDATPTSSGTASVASKNVASYTSFDSNTNTLALSDANYTLVGGVVSASISAKPVTVTGSTVANKVYDGNNTAAVSSGALQGVLGGDTVNLTEAGTFANKNVGTGKTVTVADSLSGGDAGNYTLTQPTGLSADITAKALTVTGTSVANKTYDGNTTAALSGGALQGVIGNDAVTLAEAGTFANKNVGTGKAVTAADTISGGDASNYTLTQPTGLSADITAKALTVAGSTAANKVYDGNNTATISGGALQGVIGSDAVTLTEAGTFANKNVGAGKAVTAADTISGGDAGNYTLTQPTGLSADITAKALTVAGSTAANKVYDGNNTATISGGALQGVIGSDAVTLTESGTFTNKNVGTGKAVTTTDTISGGDAGNYTLTQPTGLSADITAKALTVTGTTVASKAYDGNTTAALSGGTLQGVLGSDAVTLTEAGTFANKNAGTGKAVTAADTISGGDASNYTLTQPTGLNADITAKALTVTGTSVANKTYDGNTTAALSGGALQGVVGSDVVTLAQAGTFANKNVGTGKTVTAVDTLGGADAGNYTLTQPTGLSADITAKAVVIAGLTARDKTYDGTTSADISDWGSLTGLIGNETLVLNHGTASFADVNAGSNKTVTASGYSIADGSNGGLAGNYQLAATSATTTALIQVVPPVVPVVPVVAIVPLPPAATAIDATNTDNVVSRGAQSAAANATVVSAASNAKANPETSNITVSVVRSPSVQQAGVIAVSLPKEMAAAGAGFSFPLPAQSFESEPQTASVRVTLQNGNALPAWLKFNPESKTFSASAVPDGAFPIQLSVHVGTTTTTVVISERAN